MSDSPIAKLERDQKTAREVVLEAFAIHRKHFGKGMSTERDAFHYLCGYLGVSVEQINEILGRKQ